MHFFVEVYREEDDLLPVILLRIFHLLEEALDFILAVYQKAPIGSLSICLPVIEDEERLAGETAPDRLYLLAPGFKKL